MAGELQDSSLPPPVASENAHKKTAGRIERLANWALGRKNLSPQMEEAVHQAAEQLSAQGVTEPPEPPKKGF